MESHASPFAPLKATQLHQKIKEEIEVMTRNYGLREFDMTYTDAVGAVNHVDWDGKGQPVFTQLHAPKPAA